MTRLSLWSSFTLVVCLLQGTLYGALISGPDIIAAPSSVVNNAVDGGAENTSQQAFNEKQNVTLTVALDTDAGVGEIPIGTIVNSQMIFFNTAGSADVTDVNQTWTFDGLILGVMSDSDGLLEVASNAVLGAAGTTYPTSFAGRGLELSGGDSYSFVGNTITVTMRVTEPGDWIRVVTAPVPEPSSFLLGVLALLGGIYSRRAR